MSKEIDYSYMVQVIVVDKNHCYYNFKGFVERLSYAGFTKYIHVRLEGISTVITFKEKQLEKL